MKLSRILPVIVIVGLYLPHAAAYEDPVIVVTATRSEQERVYIPAAVTVISRDEILASGAAHLAEVLRAQGGVVINDLYGDGSRTSVSMRGFGETANANVLVLVDGRRLNNPDIADPDLNSVSLQDVERVEIIQGSGSILYGDQAVGGVINVITRRPEQYVVEAALLAGSYGRETAQAYVADAFDNGLGFSLSAESRSADNYREHNEIEYSNVFARADYLYGGGSSRAFLELQDVEDDQQNPGALFRDELEADRRQSNADFANDFNNVEHQISRAGLEQMLSEHWRLLAEYTDRDTDGEFVLSFRGFAAAPEPANRQERSLKSFTPRLAGRYETSNGALLLTAGVDREASDYFLESQLGTQRSDQKTGSYYLQAILPVLPAADLALGFRKAKVENELVDRPVFGQGVPDDADLDDDVSVFSAGLTVDASDSLRHFIRYEENYRFPKVDEHTNSPVVPFPGEASKPLATQTGESIEIGVDWARDSHSAGLVLYRLDLEDEISFDPVQFRNVNIDSTRREGLTLNTGWQPADAFHIGFNYSHLDAEIRSGIFEGNRVPFTAEHTAGLNFDWTPDERWHLYAETLYTGDRLYSGDFAAELPELQGSAMTNALLDFNWVHWKLSLRINNLTDEFYSGSGAAALGPAPDFMTVESFYPAPGRNGWLQLTYRTE